MQPFSCPAAAPCTSMHAGCFVTRVPLPPKRSSIDITHAMGHFNLYTTISMRLADKCSCCLLLLVQANPAVNNRRLSTNLTLPPSKMKQTIAAASVLLLLGCLAPLSLAQDPSQAAGGQPASTAFIGQLNQGGGGALLPGAAMAPNATAVSCLLGSVSLAFRRYLK